MVEPCLGPPHSQSSKAHKDYPMGQWQTTHPIEDRWQINTRLDWFQIILRIQTPHWGHRQGQMPAPVEVMWKVIPLLFFFPGTIKYKDTNNSTTLAMKILVLHKASNIYLHFIQFLHTEIRESKNSPSYSNLNKNSPSHSNLKIIF